MSHVRKQLWRHWILQPLIANLNFAITPIEWFNYNVVGLFLFIMQSYMNTTVCLFDMSEYWRQHLRKYLRRSVTKMSSRQLQKRMKLIFEPDDWFCLAVCNIYRTWNVTFCWLTSYEMIVAGQRSTVMYYWALIQFFLTGLSVFFSYKYIYIHIYNVKTLNKIKHASFWLTRTMCKQNLDLSRQVTLIYSVAVSILWHNKSCAPGQLLFLKMILKGNKKKEAREM